jgi:hypothetical protein
MFQVKVTAVEKLTGLSMPAFRKFDVTAAPERAAAEALAPPQGRLIRSFADIVR